MGSDGATTQRVMGDWDFELDMELKDYDEFQEIILDLKEKFLDIVRNHDFCIVSKEFIMPDINNYTNGYVWQI